MTEPNNQLKHLCLGTALWGWEGAEVDCFGVLDEFYKSGHRYIDTATIYPIDKNPETCGKSLEILSNWIKANGVYDLKVIVKIGGVNNLGSSENDLSLEFLKSENEKVHNFIKKNYYCSMVHWDNENRGDVIQKYCENLNLANLATHIGLSGVNNWSQYFDFLDKDLYLEVKNNILFNGVEKIPTRDRKDKVFVYGTSVSGLKLDKSEYQNNSYVGLARGSDYHEQQIQKIYTENIQRYFCESGVIQNFYHLGLMLNENVEGVFGIIIAPRTKEQLKDIFNFRVSLIKSLDSEKELFSRRLKGFLKE